jgi:hypothetical protein
MTSPARSGIGADSGGVYGLAALRMWRGASWIMRHSAELFRRGLEGVCLVYPSCCTGMLRVRSHLLLGSAAWALAFTPYSNSH